MGRASIKKNKTPYQQKREELGLTREQASELLEAMPPERIEKIENERIEPHPEDILMMADKYKSPELCNYYCARQCAIGQQYVPEIEVKDLHEIILELLASLNVVSRNKDRLVEIASDGKVDNDELDDYIFIEKELKKIAISVNTLKLWSDRMMASGDIDVEEYEKRKKALEETVKKKKEKQVVHRAVPIETESGYEYQVTVMPDLVPKAGAKIISRSHNNQIFQVDSKPLVIGRNAIWCKLVFSKDAPGVSGRHCQVSYNKEKKRVELMDLGSSYGTFLLNGTRLEANKPYYLDDGDSFCVGDMSNVIMIMI